MRPNRLRELLRAGKPSVGTRVYSTYPAIVEAVGHSGAFDYVEFLAEYAPFTMHDLENFCRAAELYNMSTVIKPDQEHQGFVAQRAIGSGFQGVLFVDSRTTDDVKRAVELVRPEAPNNSGYYGATPRRFAFMGYSTTPEYLQALNDIVVLIMIEKVKILERLEEVLSIPGVDMIQWGPSDFGMSSGLSRDEVKKVERRVFETALRMGVQPRAEIGTADQAKYYLDLGVRHFNISGDLWILFGFWKKEGEAMRKALEGA